MRPGGPCLLRPRAAGWFRRVGCKFAVALLDGAQHLDEGLGGCGLEVSVAFDALCGRLRGLAG